MNMAKSLCIASLCLALLCACKKPLFCGKCNTPWVNDLNLIYKKGDVVTHNGKCYKAHTQGRADSCEPGTSQGDIWNECR